MSRFLIASLWLRIPCARSCGIRLFGLPGWQGSRPKRGIGGEDIAEGEVAESLWMKRRMLGMLDREKDMQSEIVELRWSVTASPKTFSELKRTDCMFL